MALLASNLPPAGPKRAALIARLLQWMLEQRDSGLRRQVSTHNVTW